MIIKKRSLLVLLVILLLTILPGCGANATVDRATSEMVADGYAPQAGEAEVNQGVMDRKLIEYWDFNIEVHNITEAIKDIKNKTHSLKGYIVESHINNSTNNTSAHLTIKIPQENVHEMTNFLQNVGQVNNSSNRTEDITMEYYDTEARLEVLKKQEERLLSFMEQTDSVQDLLAVEQELSRVRAERESLQARMNYLNNATTYSQISIYLKQHSGGEITTPKGTWGQAVQGLITSLNSLINLANSLIIGLFMAIPYLLVIGIVYVIVNYFRKKKQK